MATFISPNGNPEVWTDKPHGYFTPEEWAVAHPAPPPPAPSTDELAALARAERNRLMREVYDPAMMQLLRRHRTAVTAGADTTEINASIAAWDAFAIALEGVPEQAGFPNEIVWPQTPAADAATTA